ncbi:transposase [Comamonas serinivorans]|nr:transposase [Comamonas serinivorans]
MARLNRLAAGGLPHHVLQRGHNAQPVALDAADHVQLLALAGEMARTTSVQIHGFALVPGAVHWLLTPQTEAGVSLFMQALGRRYGRYFNARHQRRGSLWDGRFRSMVFQPERHMLDHLLYVDTLPVRLGLVPRAEDHAWSSATHHLGEGGEPWLVAPPAYWALGNTPFERELRYRARLNEGVSAALAERIAQAVTSGWAMGDEAFLSQLTQQVGRRVQPGRRGRPRRGAADGMVEPT